MEHVAEHVGVHKKVAYRFFPNRDALLVALFTRENDRLDAVIAERVEEVRTLDAKLPRHRARVPGGARFRRAAHLERRRHRTRRTDRRLPRSESGRGHRSHRRPHLRPHRHRAARGGHRGDGVHLRTRRAHPTKPGRPGRHPTARGRVPGDGHRRPPRSRPPVPRPDHQVGPTDVPGQSSGSPPHAVRRRQHVHGDAFVAAHVEQVRVGRDQHSFLGPSRLGGDAVGQADRERVRW